MSTGQNLITSGSGSRRTFFKSGIGACAAAAVAGIPVPGAVPGPRSSGVMAEDDPSNIKLGREVNAHTLSLNSEVEAPFASA